MYRLLLLFFPILLSPPAQSSEFIASKVFCFFILESLFFVSRLTPPPYPQFPFSALTLPLILFIIISFSQLFLPPSYTSSFFIFSSVICLQLCPFCFCLCASLSNNQKACFSERNVPPGLTQGEELSSQMKPFLQV